MKKLLLSIISLLMVATSFANGGMQAQFAKAHAAAESQKIDDYGFLNAPDGASWSYTTTYMVENNEIIGVNILIYDEEKNVVGTLQEHFNLKETDLRVRQVSLNSLITKTFFNRDANYELMLWVDIATKDYKGRNLIKAYSITDSTVVHVCDIEGNQILAKNTSVYGNDNYTMVFFHQEYQGDTLYYNYDVYTKATIGTAAPKHVHTFVVPYQNIAALNDPMPLMMFQEGTEISYILSLYEKPYFVPGTSVYEDPVINEDNHFVITHYDSKFNVTAKTKIPMVKDPSDDYLYSFYYLGTLGGQDDVIKDYEGTGKMVYVITVDNYETSTDGSSYSYYLYDAEGNRMKTIVEHSLGTIRLSDVPGQPKQYGFLKMQDESEVMRMVDVPSCEQVATIPFYGEEHVLSIQWDRLPYGDSYQYVCPLLQGEEAKDGSVIQRVAWFNRDGKLNRYDTINLGKQIEYAQLYIHAPVLNPRLFDYDEAREYMALVKRPKADGTNKEEALLICNSRGEILLERGEDPEKGVLNTIDVLNIHTDPVLFCSYSKGGQYAVEYTPLPLKKPVLEGKGTSEDPYLLANAADFFLLNDEPGAKYQVVADIDFANIPFPSIAKNFAGVLDGGNHTLSNLCLQGGGLLNAAVDSVVIKNLIIDRPYMVLTGVNTAGILANVMRGGYDESGMSDESVPVEAVLSNIQLVAPTISANEFTGTIGGMIGEASLFLAMEQAAVLDAHFVAPKAEAVGGIVGSMATSSSMQASVFTGMIEGGKEVGGLAAVVGSGEPIINSHVNADLTATNTLGGVVARSARAKVNNCLVEGTLRLVVGATQEGAVGGIVGNLEQDATESQTEPIVEHCLVALDSMLWTADETATVVAHRIVGFSSVDQYEYDWDHVDWNQDQDKWPRIYGKPEKCLKDNYVISKLAVVDTAVVAEANTTEGATYAEELTTEWLTEQGFIFCEQVSEPWLLDADGLRLWYEDDLGLEDAVDNIVIGDGLIFEDTLLIANGDVHVYTVNGMLVLQGRDKVDTALLKQGVYIVTVTNNAHRAAVKVLIP